MKREYVDFDIRDKHAKFIMPYIKQIMDVCYKLGVPAYYFAATKNSINSTEYSGMILSPETLGISLATDTFKNLDSNMITDYEKKSVDAFYNKKKEVENSLAKALDYLKSVLCIINCPFVLRIASANTDEDTTYFGRVLYSEVKTLHLADDRFKKHLFGDIIDYVPGLKDF